MCRHSSVGAFTLVELLIVAAIFGIMVTAIVSCLVAGIRTWDYARKYSGVEAVAMISLESMHRDIANTFRFYSIAFRGAPRELAFSGLVDVSDDGGEYSRIGTIKYYFDAGKKVVLRKAWAFPGSEPADDKAEKIFSGVSDMTLNYYALPSGSERGAAWQEGWNDTTNIPGAVTVELAFDADNAQSLKIKRTVMIPAAAVPVSEPVQQTKSGVPIR